MGLYASHEAQFVPEAITLRGNTDGLVITGQPLLSIEQVEERYRLTGHELMAEVQVPAPSEHVTARDFMVFRAARAGAAILLDSSVKRQKGGVTAPAPLHTHTIIPRASLEMLCEINAIEDRYEYIRTLASAALLTEMVGPRTPDPTIVIGRDRAFKDVFKGDNTVSRSHCWLVAGRGLNADSIAAYDRSANGTRITRMVRKRDPVVSM